MCVCDLSRCGVTGSERLMVTGHPGLLTLTLEMRWGIVRGVRNLLLLEQPYLELETLCLRLLVHLEEMHVTSMVSTRSCSSSAGYVKKSSSVQATP